MSDAQEPTQAAQTAPVDATAPTVEVPKEEPKKFITSMDVTLPSTGEVTQLQKLKAGKYYEAQKLYVEWIQSLQGAFAQQSGIDAATILKEDGTPNEAKIKEAVQKNSSGGGIDITALLSKISEAAGKRMELLSKCLEKPKEEIENNYYPEDIDLLIDKVIELNGFMNNLKKSVAPSGGLGA